jgi:hypothetical protein
LFESGHDRDEDFLSRKSRCPEEGNRVDSSTIPY